MAQERKAQMSCILSVHDDDDDDDDLDGRCDDIFCIWGLLCNVKSEALAPTAREHRMGRAPWMTFTVWIRRIVFIVHKNYQCHTVACVCCVPASTRDPSDARRIDSWFSFQFPNPNRKPCISGTS